MMKMMILAPRRPDMTHEEFRHYVTRIHGPLVRSVPEVAADIRHYHYNFPMPGVAGGAVGHPLASEIDIVTQGWFDSREAQLRNMTRPGYLEIIRPDEGRFADERRAVMHYTDERVILDGAATQTKVFYFRRLSASLTRAAFQRAWAEAYPAAIGAVLADETTLGRYVQNLVQSEADHPHGEDPKYYDVIDEFCLAEAADLAAFGRNAAMSARVRVVEGELLDRARTRAFVARTVYNIP